MEEAYKLRLPFDATWAAAERTAAVFGFLRGVGRAVGREGGSALGLLPALRSRYTQLYRQVFGRRQTGLAAPDGSSLCGGVTPTSGADGSEADEDRALLGLLGGKQKSLDELRNAEAGVAALLRPQPAAIAAINAANFAEHLLMWAVQPLRGHAPPGGAPLAPPVKVGAGNPAAEATEAVWLPSLVAACAKQQLVWEG